MKSRTITLDKLDNILKITDNENAMVTEIIGELEGKGKVLNQYSKFNDLPLEYDTNGNLSAKGSRLFAYDYRNRLVRSSKGDDAVTFTYDIFGRQTSRTDVSGTLHFFYAGDQKIEERNTSGQVTKQYFWGNGIDELLRLDVFNGSSSTPYYVHTDNIGSTTAVTDENGNLVERVTYDVYGLPTFTDALGQTLKKSTIRNTTLFQGREYDYDLSLYNYRARYFDPSLGRFLQTDPLGYQDSMNLYQGMNMNPLNFVDPRGLVSGKFRILPHIYPNKEALADQYIAMNLTKSRIYKPLTFFIDPKGINQSVDDVLSYSIEKRSAKFAIKFNLNLDIHVYLVKNISEDVSHENRHVKDMYDVYKRIKNYLERIETLEFDLERLPEIEYKLLKVKRKVKEEIESANKWSVRLLDTPVLSFVTEMFRIIQDEIVSWFVDDAKIFMLQNELEKEKSGGMNGDK